MTKANILENVTFSSFSKPKKLIFLLHGYGDNANNFINIARPIHTSEWQINYISLNAPTLIPNTFLGFEWFDIYPNGIYISDAGANELNEIRSEILISVKKIVNSIIKIKDNYKLDFSDCFVIGFSQGGIMTFEVGSYLQNKLAGLAIISGRIMEKNIINNNFFLNTPIFISHGEKDEVLPIKNFYKSCNFLKKNKFNYEDYLLKGDSHTISSEAIDLLQKFIKKNL